jgi:hypothetical protein
MLLYHKFRILHFLYHIWVSTKNNLPAAMVIDSDSYMDDEYNADSEIDNESDPEQAIYDDPIGFNLEKEGDDFTKFIDFVIYCSNIELSGDAQDKRSELVIQLLSFVGIESVIDCVRYVYELNYRLNYNLSITQLNLSDLSEVSYQLTNDKLKFITLIGAEWLVRTEYNSSIHTPDLGSDEGTCILTHILRKDIERKIPDGDVQQVFKSYEKDSNVEELKSCKKTSTKEKKLKLILFTVCIHGSMKNNLY